MTCKWHFRLDIWCEKIWQHSHRSCLIFGWVGNNVLEISQMMDLNGRCAKSWDKTRYTSRKSMASVVGGTSARRCWEVSVVPQPSVVDRKIRYFEASALVDGSGQVIKDMMYDIWYTYAFLLEVWQCESETKVEMIPQQVVFKCIQRFNSTAA